MTMDDDLVKLVSNICGENSRMQAWLAEELVFTVEDMGLLARDEEYVDTVLVPAAKAKQVPAATLMDCVKIKKVWKLCRNAHNASPSHPCRKRRRP